MGGFGLTSVERSALPSPARSGADRGTGLPLCLTVPWTLANRGRRYAFTELHSLGNRAAPLESENQACSSPQPVIAVLVGVGSMWHVRATRPVARKISLQSMFFLFVQGLTSWSHSLMVSQESGRGTGALRPHSYVSIVFPVSQSCCCLRLASVGRRNQSYSI